MSTDAEFDRYHEVPRAIIEAKGQYYACTAPEKPPDVHITYSHKCSQCIFMARAHLRMDGDKLGVDLRHGQAVQETTLRDWLERYDASRSEGEP
jgi:hypothetical protein